MALHTKGLTIVELMAVLAILSILAAIAIPAYNGYLRESRISVAQINANSLRVVLEDHFLENSSYVVGGDTSYTKAELETNFGWTPDGDKGAYSYAVDVENPDTVTDRTWHVTVEHIASGTWIRCENRISNCCDIDTPGATKEACTAPEE